MHNVGTVDRIIRALVGILFLALVFVGPESVWGWIGLIPLATAVYAYCPLYTVLGINKSMESATDSILKSTLVGFRAWPVVL